MKSIAGQLGEIIKATPLCSFEAKLVFKDYSISVRKTCQSKEMVRFSFTLNAEKGKIKLKIHKSRIIAAFSAFVPQAVKTGTKSILAIMENIQLGKQAAVISLFSKVFEELTNAEKKKKNGDDVTHHDVIIDDEISMEEVVHEELFTALSTLDLKIRLSSMNVDVDIRKREVLAGIRRKTVVLDAEKTLKFKEPRAIFGRAQVQSAVSALEVWVEQASSSKEFSARAFFPEVMKTCQKFSEVNIKKH